MSLQVGDSCYPTVLDAGAAACAQFRPVSMLTPDGAALKSASCGAVDATTGALQMTITTTPVDGTAATVQTIAHELAYMACQDQAKVDAALAVFVAFLTLAATSYGLWLVYQWVNRGARNQE